MIIDITDVKINKEKEIDILLGLESDILSRGNILSIEDIKVTGIISAYNVNDYYLDLIVCGKIFVPCSMCLKPAEIAIDIVIEGSFSEMMEEISPFERNTGNTIDILPIIWENILTEIPIKINCREH